MSSKSKKLEAIDNNYATLVSNRTHPQLRWANVFRDDIMRGDDLVTVYYFHAGADMMPADYKDEFDTIEELEKAMREFNNDLRKWSYGTGW